jgi:hypothetical protein
MQIGIPMETVAGESRVAATPETVKKLVGAGHSVVIQKGQGVKRPILMMLIRRSARQSLKMLIKAVRLF